MNDFLTNLIGRARRTLEVVQPRIPSIYEPYRRGNGLPGVQPGLRQPDPASEPSLEAEFEGGAEPAHVSPRADTLRARNGVPRRDARSEPAVEPGTEGREIASNHQTHKPRTGAASPAVGEIISSDYDLSQRGTGLRSAHLGLRRRDASSEPAAEGAWKGDAEIGSGGRQSHQMRKPASAEAHGGESSQDEPHTPPADGLKRASSSGSVAPSLIPHAIPHRDLAMEADASPKLPLTSLQPRPASANARESQLIAASPGEARGDTSESSLPLAPSQLSAREVVAERSSSPETKSTTSIARLGALDPVQPRRSAEPPVVAHPTSTVARTVLPLSAPSLVARPAPVTGAVRPPLAPRSGDANRHEARPSSGPTNPEIQVSIGKVEVRAVFPAPPAPRAQPTRRRPTVSLDDYLNRRHRGRR